MFSSYPAVGGLTGRASLIFTIVSLPLAIYGLPTVNIAGPLPPGITNHGDPHLLCTATKWDNVLSFFLVNYVAHAATTISFPGEKIHHHASNVMLALLFPSAGVARGLNAIFRCANFAKGDLQKAARAGALCMVVRMRHPRPLEGDDSFRYIHISKSDIQRTRTIHGVSRDLPPGFTYAFVPPNEEILTIPGGNIATIPISSSYNAVTVAIAIFQTLYASITLYNSRGGQISRYGYAAFSLTVVPYAVMSVVNLIGALLTPSYPTLYLVRSEAMVEVERTERYFDGVVGELRPPADQDGNGQNVGGVGNEVPAAEEDFFWIVTRPYWLPIRQLIDLPHMHPPRLAGLLVPMIGIILVLLPHIIALGIPIAIIGLTSHFRCAKSTLAQRVWTMSWLAFGYVGAAMETIKPNFRDSVRMSAMYAAPYSAPAIGGFVVVGQMLREYGDCIRFGG